MEYARGDVRDRTVLEDAFAGADVVIHLAFLITGTASPATLLRRHVPHAGRWIGATAAAWLLALVLFTAVPTPLWQPGQPVAVTALIGALGGVVMAGTVAAVTGPRSSACSVLGPGTASAERGRVVEDRRERSPLGYR